MTFLVAQRYRHWHSQWHKIDSATRPEVLTTLRFDKRLPRKLVIRVAQNEKLLSTLCSVGKIPSVPMQRVHVAEFALIDDVSTIINRQRLERKKVQRPIRR